MANMTFKANLLPNSNLGYSLGSSEQKWNVYGDLKGNADTATKISSTPNNTSTFLRGDNTWSRRLMGALELGSPDETTYTHLDIGRKGTNEVQQHLYLCNASDGTYALIERNSGTTTTGLRLYDDYVYTTKKLSISGTIRSTDSIYSSTTEREAQIGVSGSSGNLYLYSETNARNRGLYAPAHGTGSAVNIINVDTNNIVTFNGRFSSYNLTDMAFTWSSSYSTGQYMLIYNGEDGPNGGKLFRAITQANTAAWVDAQHKWVRVGGDTMTGTLKIVNNTQNDSTDALLYIEHKSTADWGIKVNKNNEYDWGINVQCNSSGSHGIDCTGRITGTTVYGAVWNDYAEFRKTCDAKPGQCVLEIEQGKLKISDKRCAPAARVVSDTFGFAIGETEECKTPIAVSGRVLVYTDNSKLKIGDAVCSGKNGTVTKMRWYERILYPERIVGTVSEFPDYEEWLAGERDGNHCIKINGRIWIYVK